MKGKIDNICVCCGINFTSQYKRQFCTKSCASKMKNHNRRMKQTTCKQCGIVFVHLEANERIYCSKTCAGMNKNFHTKRQLEKINVPYTEVYTTIGKSAYNDLMREYLSKGKKIKRYLPQPSSDTIFEYEMFF